MWDGGLRQMIFDGETYVAKTVSLPKTQARLVSFRKFVPNTSTTVDPLLDPYVGNIEDTDNAIINSNQNGECREEYVWFELQSIREKSTFPGMCSGDTHMRWSGLPQGIIAWE